MTRLMLFGSGGHAKVVLETIRAAHPAVDIVVLDDATERVGGTLIDLPIVGGRGWITDHGAGAALVPAIGENRARIALIDWAEGLGIAVASIVHPSAIVSPSAKVAPGCFIAPGVIVNAGTRLGRGVVVNTAASIDHDCVVGDGGHIGPGARLCGGVTVGAETLVGVGAAVIPGVTIGARCVIGAGAAVTVDVPDQSRATGVPARIMDRTDR